MSSNVRQIIISGAGGSAAAVAVAMAVSLQGSGIGITLLRSPESGQLRSVEEFRGGAQGFHARLGLDESTLYKQTNAVYGMGTRYRGLSERAETAFVPLGDAWPDAAACRFSSLCCQVTCRGGRARLSTTGRSLRLRRRRDVSIRHRPALNRRCD